MPNRKKPDSPIAAPAVGVPAEPAEPSTPLVNVKIETPPGGTQFFHSDYFLVHWSLFDLKVRFGELVNFDVPSKSSIVCDRMVVTMSWNHAKQLASQLQDAVSRYERANGELKIIPNLNLP